MVEVKEYVRREGHSPFADWFDRLNVQAALKVNTCLTRVSNGHTSMMKGIGAGVHECRIDWGPGYRIYLGKDGDKLVILLGGGTKKRQQKDIETAKALWQDYKKRKKEQ